MRSQVVVLEVTPKNWASVKWKYDLACWVAGVLIDPKSVEILAAVRLACVHALQLLNFITLFLSLQQDTAPKITNTIKMLPKEDNIVNFKIPIYKEYLLNMIKEFKQDTNRYLNKLSEDRNKLIDVHKKLTAK